MLLQNKKLIHIDDFSFGKVLGSGAQGIVQAALNKQDDQVYAIKALNKQHIIEQKQVDHIYSELITLHSVSHQNIVKFFGYDIDDNNIYYQLELVRGFSLFYYLDQKQLSQYHACFYITQCILALQYLHDNDIVYRDLKPENIMIDHKGYLKLTDFGFAKKIGKARTYTFCGTPEYLAPEVINNSGYGKTVDYWSIGILLYEMLLGETPFYDQDPIKMYEKIIKQEIQFPPKFDRQMKKIIEMLTEKDPMNRMMKVGQNLNELLKQKIFKKVDLKGVEQQIVEAPYAPNNSIYEDMIQNFEEGIPNGQRLRSDNDPFKYF